MRLAEIRKEVSPTTSFFFVKPSNLSIRFLVITDRGGVTLLSDGGDFEFRSPHQWEAGLEHVERLASQRISGLALGNWKQIP